MKPQISNQVQTQAPNSPGFLDPGEIWEEAYQEHISMLVVKDIEDLLIRYAGVVVIGVVTLDKENKPQFEELFISVDLPEEEVEDFRDSFYEEASYLKDRSIEDIMIALSSACGLSSNRFIIIYDRFLRYVVIALTTLVPLERGTLW